MGEALEAVRLGHMSINQAAIHYNLPYSSLYGRFKRGIKYDSDNIEVSYKSLVTLVQANNYKKNISKDTAGKPPTTTTTTPTYGGASFRRSGV